MRKLEFNQLKLKKNINEETFYQAYLKNLQDTVTLNAPLPAIEKQYEIFYLNILGGKLILLNKDYINTNEDSNSDLFYDYSIALKVYTLMLDIEDGIDAEKYEANELYKDERLKKNYEIEQLRKQDDILFKNKSLPKD